ncbi:hypothetical protein NLJ89_g10084 [Agrocybe chaxingu]|uniref:Uncharacterized protein n=1 Tax=Agrocybe chaxingu TaxID=84603 RepID=A0A9W8JSC5_9AGAR|nr:hypothetical protein NLJ89_g10084 [Agrocybe chaxingu]
MLPSWRLITLPDGRMDSTRKPADQQRQRPFRLRSSWLTSAYPWSNSVVFSEQSFNDVFREGHFLHPFIKSLEDFEYDKFCSPDADSFKFKSALCIDELLHLKDSQSLSEMKVDVKAALPVCTYICAHKLVDVVSLLHSVQDCASATFPTHPKHHNFGDIDGKSWEHLHDWPALLKKTRAMLRKAQSAGGGVLSLQCGTQPTAQEAQHLVLLNSVVGRDSTVKLAKILSNIEIAAMHLNVMLQGNIDLPDKLSWFSSVKSVSEGELSAEAQRFLAPFIKTPHRLRLPLHLALLISPLYLLVFAQLHKKDWDRWKLVITSFLLGNQKPRLLTSTELALWRVIFTVARGGKSTILALLDELESLPWDELTSMPEEDRLWFQPAHTQQLVPSSHSAISLDDSVSHNFRPSPESTLTFGAESTLPSARPIGPDTSTVGYTALDMYIDQGGERGSEKPTAKAGATSADEIAVELTCLNIDGDRHNTMVVGQVSLCTDGDSTVAVEHASLGQHGDHDSTVAANQVPLSVDGDGGENMVTRQISLSADYDAAITMAVEQTSPAGEQDNLMAVEQMYPSLVGEQDNHMDVDQSEHMGENGTPLPAPQTPDPVAPEAMGENGTRLPTPQTPDLEVTELIKKIKKKRTKDGKYRSKNLTRKPPSHDKDEGADSETIQVSIRKSTLRPRPGALSAAIEAEAVLSLPPHHPSLGGPKMFLTPPSNNEETTSGFAFAFSFQILFYRVGS